MKRHTIQEPKVHFCKKLTISKKPIFCFFDALPQDIKNIVIDYVINDTSEKKPKEVALVFNNLACVNKNFNSLINDPQYKNNPLFTDNLIEKLSERYKCSHESIAHFLHTKAALDRIRLQRRLNSLFFKSENDKIIEKRLTELIKKGVNLNFTYNHYHTQKTPLMIAATSGTKMFDLLIEKKADINAHNSHGLTVLKMLLEPSANKKKLRTLLSQKNLQLNQQDKKGTTPLLHMLINKNHRNMRVIYIFIKTLNILLKENVDLELENKYGLTPVQAAINLYPNAPEVANLILNAIERKKENKSSLNIALN